jgi:predicted RNA-binding protein YlqC (UPF0109 family)
MKELVEFIATSLVDDPTQVHVNQIRRGAQIVLKLEVAKEDMGRIIGRNGKVANAIRTLLRVPASQEGKRIILDIVEPE